MSERPSQLMYDLPDEQYPGPCVYYGYLNVWELALFGKQIIDHVPVEIAYDGTEHDLDDKMAALRDRDYAYDSNVSIVCDRIEQAPRTPVPHAFLAAFKDA